VKLKGFQKLTSTTEALRAWLGALQIKKPNEIAVSLQEAYGRILAVDILAKDDLPRFDKSAVDGYALKAEDTLGASQFKPAAFQLTQAEQVTDKQAKQVWTGNPIPKGANAVVMLENTKTRDGGLEVWSQLAPGDNVSKKGEDIKKGEKPVKAGTRLNPYHIALAAALGYSQVKVYDKPKIAILATGNELAELGTQPVGNQIYDSNKIMLSVMCQELGVQTLDLGIAKDNLDEISEKIRLGLETCDAVITTGGTSVGGLDLVPDAVNKLGKLGVIVHGVALRPGMPTALAVLDGKPILILSGNPVAAIVGFEVFGRIVVCRMLGLSKEEPRPVLKAVLARKVASALGRKTYVRVRVFERDGEFFAEPVSAKGSGAISTMTMSNGFVIVPENREGLAEGETVTVHMFGRLESEN
jgi:molybdenum cofactor synthesis domain-containing protein